MQSITFKGAGHQFSVRLVVWSPSCPHEQGTKTHQVASPSVWVTLKLKKRIVPKVQSSENQAVVDSGASFVLPRLPRTDRSVSNDRLSPQTSTCPSGWMLTIQLLDGTAQSDCSGPLFPHPRPVSPESFCNCLSFLQPLLKELRHF